MEFVEFVLPAVQPASAGEVQVLRNVCVLHAEAVKGRPQLHRLLPFLRCHIDFLQHDILLILHENAGPALPVDLKAQHIHSRGIEDFVIKNGFHLPVLHIDPVRHIPYFPFHAVDFLRLRDAHTAPDIGISLRIRLNALQKRIVPVGAVFQLDLFIVRGIPFQVDLPEAGFLPPGRNIQIPVLIRPYAGVRGGIL